jgi:hypothetical protein
MFHQRAALSISALSKNYSRSCICRHLPMNRRFAPIVPKLPPSRSALINDRYFTFRYLTTSDIGMERGDPLAEGVPGLKLWDRTKVERDVARRARYVSKLSKFLIESANLPADLKEYLETATDEEILADLIRPISWETDAGPLSTLLEEVKRHLVLFGSTKGIAASDAEKVVGALHLEAWTVATRPGRARKSVQGGRSSRCAPRRPRQRDGRDPPKVAEPTGPIRYPFELPFYVSYIADNVPTLGSNFLLAGRDTLTNRRRSQDLSSIVGSSHRLSRMPRRSADGRGARRGKTRCSGVSLASIMVSSRPVARRSAGEKRSAKRICPASSKSIRPASTAARDERPAADHCRHRAARRRSRTASTA